MGNEGLDEGWSERLSWLPRALSYRSFMFDNREKFLALYGQDTSTVVGQNDKHQWDRRRLVLFGLVAPEKGDDGGMTLEWVIR